MNPKKVLVIFACIMTTALLYVFGTMYMTSNDQAGGGGSSSSNATGDTSQGGGTTNSNSPGNNGSTAQQSTGANQTANPTGAAAQENFVQGAEVQTQPIPTQPINVPRQTSAGSSNGNSIGTAAQNSTQQQSQNNLVNNAQPQITQNPLGAIQ